MVEDRFPERGRYGRMSRRQEKDIVIGGQSPFRQLFASRIVFVEIHGDIRRDPEEQVLEQDAHRIGELGLVAVQVVTGARDPLPGQVTVHVGDRKDVDVGLPQDGRIPVQRIHQGEQAFGTGGLISMDGALEPDLQFGSLRPVGEADQREETARKRCRHLLQRHVRIPCSPTFQPGYDPGMVRHPVRQGQGRGIEDLGRIREPGLDTVILGLVGKAEKDCCQEDKGCLERLHNNYAVKGLTPK